MLTEAEFSRAYAELNVRAVEAVSRTSGNYHDAQDAVQVAWIEAWGKRDSLDPGRIIGWICFVARRVLWKMKRPNWSSDGRSRIEAPETVGFCDEHDAEVEPELQENAARDAMVEKSIDTLTVPWTASNGKKYERAASPAIKDTMRLLYRIGNGAEVARMRGVRVQANMENITRGIAALREKWSIKPCPTN